MIERGVAAEGGDLGFSRLARFSFQPRSNSSSVGDRGASLSKTELSPAQQQLVARLRETDRAVRAHEAAHLTVGGDLVRGGASFSYAIGSDRKRYAVSGEVSIDVSAARTPQETIPKAQHIRATALAPVDPSPQDHAVAAGAARLENKARSELASALSEQASQGRSGALSRLYGENGLPASEFRRQGESIDHFI